VVNFSRASSLGLVGLVLAACDGGQVVDTADDTDSEVQVGNIIVDPCVVDFGTLLPGEDKGQTITVRNTGNGPLTVTSVAVEAPFTQSSTPPFTVTGNYSLTVRFEPAEGQFGKFTSELVIQSDDPQDPSVVCSLTGAVTDDADLDGFRAVEAGGDDCDDADPEVNPGAEEIWYDGEDQNCDERSDYDQDGDGYDTKVFWADPENVNPATGNKGGDCQDVDPTMNPGVEEVWYDGKDADCNGQNDFDQDGDGYRTAALGFDDCDDNDALANPLAVEAFNGKDDDCNGKTDDKASPERADKIAYGSENDFAAGRSIAVEDFDNNGVADVVVGVHYALYATTAGGDAPGGFAIFWDDGIVDGDLVGDEGDEDVWVAGANKDDELGYELISVPDFDGDRRPDLIVSAVAFGGYDGRVYVFSGADLSSTTTIASADLTITGLNNYKIGGGLGFGDFDADGFSDLMMFGSHQTDVFSYLGIHYGSSSALGAIDWTGIDATFRSKCGSAPIYSWYITTCGPDAYSWTPGVDGGGNDAYLQNGHFAADLDGDGYDDILHGDSWNDEGSVTNGGRAWVLFGRRAQYTNANSDFTGSMTVVGAGKAANDGFGISVGIMPDVNGDGADEAMLLDDASSTLYVLYGGSDMRAGLRDLEEESEVIIRGVGVFGTSINAGDWTGDGVDDAAIAMGVDKGSGAKGGGLYLFPSLERRGTYKLDDFAFGSLVGGDFNGAFGLGAPLTTGDLDGNGTSDLVLGDFKYDNTDLTKEGTEGGVFVFYNRNE
jgi:hypothetical protein